MATVAANPFSDGRTDEKRATVFTLVIFGVTGDLTRKKLVPALFSLCAHSFLDRFSIVGFARRAWTDDDFRSEARSMLSASEAGTATGNTAEAEALNSFLARLSYLSSSFDDPKGYENLLAVLSAGAASGRKTILYYLSTPPESYQTIIEHIGAIRGRLPPGVDERIVIEKPFGRGGESARALDLFIHRFFTEDRIYRIDHYLGKDTVQNILAFRFGNGLFEPIWNSRFIDRIEITVAETAGVGTRGGYYESAGALRDMVQNHLFQLLALTAMEPPNDLAAESIRAEKQKVFRAIQPFDRGRLASDTVRAQYSAGTIDGVAVPGYREEKGVAPESPTETYVALKVMVDSWRWAGTPFYLRVGKRLPRRMSEIAVYFRKPPLGIFPGPGAAENVLVFRIQPDDGFSLSVNTKIPGFSAALRPALMDFSYGSGFADAPPDAYERLILDALLGDPSLYTSSGEVEACWDVIDPILASWEAGTPALRSYPAGSAGPEAARDLVAREGRRWRKL
jgi:glucose-6-phosphate 1-dehydrogenase